MFSGYRINVVVIVQLIVAEGTMWAYFLSPFSPGGKLCKLYNFIALCDIPANCKLILDFGTLSWIIAPFVLWEIPVVGDSKLGELAGRAQSSTNYGLVSVFVHLTFSSDMHIEEDKLHQKVDVWHLPLLNFSYLHKSFVWTFCVYMLQVIKI